MRWAREIGSPSRELLKKINMISNLVTINPHQGLCDIVICNKKYIFGLGPSSGTELLKPLELS